MSFFVKLKVQTHGSVSCGGLLYLVVTLQLIITHLNLAAETALN